MISCQKVVGRRGNTTQQTLGKFSHCDTPGGRSGALAAPASDPFAASLGVSPPAYVQILDLEKQQKQLRGRFDVAAICKQRKTKRGRQDQEIYSCTMHIHTKIYVTLSKFVIKYAKLILFIFGSVLTLKLVFIEYI